jgi:hypothetical protein
MKFSKLAGLSLKSLKHTGAAATAMGTAVAVFCICFAGSALVSVRKEKAMPYELVVERRTDGTMLTDDDIFKISRIPGVHLAETWKLVL